MSENGPVIERIVQALQNVECTGHGRLSTEAAIRTARMSGFSDGRAYAKRVIVLMTDEISSPKVTYYEAYLAKQVCV